MGKPSTILLVINVNNDTTGAMVKAYCAKHPVAKIIACRTRDDLWRLHPQAAHWDYIKFAVSEGVTAPEELAAWVRKRAFSRDFSVNVISLESSDRRQAERNLPTSFAGRFYAALQQPSPQQRQQQRQRQRSR